MMYVFTVTLRAKRTSEHQIHAATEQDAITSAVQSAIEAFCADPPNDFDIEIED